MKFKTIHIALIVILILLIFVGPYSTSVVPYSKDTLFSNMYKYEGVQNMGSYPATGSTPNTGASPTSNNEPRARMNTRSTPLGLPPNQSSDLPGQPQDIGSLSPLSKTTTNTTNIADIYNAATNSIYQNSQNSATAKKVEGFALQPAPFSDNPVLDRYGSTPSGSQCFGKSSGYSNSLGPLCFSQEDVKLLSTRGGNISGTDSIIGR